MSSRIAISTLIFFSFFQLVYSFLFPAYALDENWLQITAYLPKFEAASSDNFILDKLYPLISSEYRLGSDTGNYLELAQNFNARYFDGHTFLVRPLYSLIVFLMSLPFRLLGMSSYGIIFGLSILLNLILLTGSAILLFSLFRRLISPKVGYLSAILLIFSPYVHASLIQPLAEILMVFAVSLTAYLLYDYLKKPSGKKLVIYSLLTGIFMLGKMFFAVLFFILFLAVYFRRYKEGLFFLAFHLIPTGLWYLWITQVWQIPYSVYDAQHWGMGIWLLDIFRMPWWQLIWISLSSPADFIRALIFGFFLWPVLFSVIGLAKLPFKQKNVFYFGAMLSMLGFLFVINLYYGHHAFLLFPIIYPAAVLGIEKVFPKPVLQLIVIGAVIFISNINVYRVFDYLK